MLPICIKMLPKACLLEKLKAVSRQAMTEPNYFTCEEMSCDPQWFQALWIITESSLKIWSVAALRGSTESKPSPGAVITVRGRNLSSRGDVTERYRESYRRRPLMPTHTDGNPVLTRTRNLRRCEGIDGQRRPAQQTFAGSVRKLGTALSGQDTGRPGPGEELTAVRKRGVIPARDSRHRGTAVIAVVCCQNSLRITANSHNALSGLPTFSNANPTRRLHALGSIRKASVLFTLM